MFIKFLPNEYVLRYRKGKLIERGAGLTFHFFDKSTAVAVVPMSAMDADFIFEEKTADFQSVSVQGQLTYRITDCEKIASLMNFTVKLRSKEYHDNPLKKLSKRIINIADVIIRNHVETVELKEAVKANRELSGEIFDRLREVGELSALGIEILGFSILRISAGTETHRALEARTREEILKESDDALYERRNASIEQERRVKENELSTEISVAEKKKKIKETEVGTERMLLESENELERMRVAAEVERQTVKQQNENDLERMRIAAEVERETVRQQKENDLERMRVAAEVERETVRLDAEIELERKRRELADLKLENAKKDADAEAYRIGGVMDAYSRLNPEVLVALATLNMDPQRIIAGAFEKLAVNSGKIGMLNITPDLLESLTNADA